MYANQSYCLYIAPVANYHKPTKVLSFLSGESLVFQGKARLEICAPFGPVTRGQTVVIRYAVPTNYYFNGDWLGVFCNGVEMGLVEMVDAAQSQVSGNGLRTGHVEWRVPERLSGQKFDIRWVHSSYGSQAPLFSSGEYTVGWSKGGFLSGLANKLWVKRQRAK
jgi:hypothetical protein